MTPGTECRRSPRPWWGAKWMPWAALACGLAAVIAFVPGVQPGASAQSTSLAGSQGIVAALPATSSVVTVSGRGAFSSLRITVNQTTNLVNQAISVSWTGSVPTAETPTDSYFEQNYLQMFECWGTPSASDPLTAVNPGPPPTQCEFGAQSLTPTSSYPISQAGFEYTRILAATTWSDYSPTPADGACIDPDTAWDVEPFDAVDGTVVCQQYDAKYLADDQPFWMNPDYSFNTTNEVDFARTYSTPGGGGEGTQLFQVDTGLEAPGLGCGQAVEPAATGGDVIPQCWLVVVPRGMPAQENPPGVDASTVESSPLTPEAWNNRIAIPLDFQPVGSSCSLQANTDRIDGGELALGAVSSWQPALCATADAPSFDYTETGDEAARENIISPSYGSASMSVFSEPISSSETDSSNPVVYAPLTLSGVVVAFNIDRVPISDAATGFEPDPDELPLQGTQVAHIYLTPRLVAKLLTESYPDELQDVPPSTPGYSWIADNPHSLVEDPDFLQYNPEFSELESLQGADSATLVVEEPDSDTTAALWNWVLSDPAAAAWLDGQPDPWGMKVDPYYSTNPAINPSGMAFGSPVPDSFPKSDPYCFSTGDTIGTPAQLVPPLCVQDWSPYAGSMQAAAQAAATANDGAKTVLNPQGTIETPWSADGPQETSTQFIMCVTDSASAAQYGLSTASLSRDGDDGSDPVFVTSDQQSILAGEQAMVESATPGVLQPDPASTAAGAYPLPMLTYAAATPNTLDSSSRQAYASFLQYAAGAGQVPGTNPGQLPAGYVPLPAALERQTVAAAATILNPPNLSTPVRSSTPTPIETFTTPVSSAETPENGSATGQQPTKLIAITGRTPAESPGTIRWTIPMILAVGLVLAAGDALFGLKRRPRRRAASREPPPGPQAASTLDDRPKPVVFEPW